MGNSHTGTDHDLTARLNVQKFIMRYIFSEKNQNKITNNKNVTFKNVRELLSENAAPNQKGTNSCTINY